MYPRSIGSRRAPVLRRLRRRLHVPGSLLLGLLILLCLVSPALAQQTSPTPTPVPSVAAETQPAVTNLSLLLVLAVLVFLLLALGTVFVYTYFVQSKYYEVAERLGLAGKATTVVAVQTFTTAGAAPPGAAPAQTKVRISGPGAVTVGTLSEPFQATLDPDDPNAVINWSVAPDDAMAVVPRSGRTVKVIATRAGEFTLTADVQGVGQTQVTVTATAPQSPAIELPFVGRGYGTIAIATVLIAAVIVLAVTGVLSGEGAATLLGALLGYIFGVASGSLPRGQGGNGGREGQG